MSRPKALSTLATSEKPESLTVSAALSAFSPTLTILLISSLKLLTLGGESIDRRASQVRTDCRLNYTDGQMDCNRSPEDIICARDCTMIVEPSCGDTALGCAMVALILIGSVICKVYPTCVESVTPIVSEFA